MSDGVALRKDATAVLDAVSGTPGVARAFIDRAGQVPQLQITVDRQHQERKAGGSTQKINNGHELNADAQGMIAAMLSTKDLAPGAYTLVAHGLSSDATVVIAFQVQ